MEAVSSKSRNDRDFYQTPPSMTWQLFDHHTEFDPYGSVLEPCVGDGAIYNVLQQYFKSTIDANDISLPCGCDFLKNNFKSYDYIITNPPFSLANEFVQKCKQIARKQFALLVDTDFKHGINRFKYKIFLDPEYRLKYEYTFVRRPYLSEFVRDDGKYDTGMITFCWYVWERGYTGEPVLRWINNQNYVLSSGDKDSEDQLQLFSKNNDRQLLIF